ncbi:MAG: hypothetical protein NDJ89_11290 [Oligoflexia bacterium]|nr:hypothetical protein [Oligoflexia bacterium]
MKKALSRLDQLLTQPVTLIVGGGGAMILAHEFPLATSDLDAVPKGMDIHALDPLVKQIAKEQGLPPDWLNPYFSTYAHTLPTDYQERLIEVFSGDALKALALGKKDLLSMKCFADFQKGFEHGRSLKGLERIPSLDELAQAYSELQNAKDALPAERLALWSQWSRLDPRLAEQLVAHLSRYWRDLNPLELHTALVDQPWPAALGVLLEYAKERAQEPRLMKAWNALVLSGIPVAEGELFFIGLRQFAGKLMREDARLSHKHYRRWGYLGRETLFNKAVSGDKTRLAPEIRAQLLEELLSDRQRITVREYREALGGQITARMAELDLRAHPRLVPRSRTKGRYYLKR